MIKSIISLLSVVCFLFSSLNVSAKQVPQSEARDYAKLVFATKAKHKLNGLDDIKVIQSYTRTTKDGEASYYIFNLQPTGFVIISAHDVYNPVLGFSDESQINLDNLEQSQTIFNTLGKHELNIETLRKEGIIPPPSVQEEWKYLKTGDPSSFLTKDPDGVVVPPLTTTLWNQGEFYNAYTPKDSDPDAIAGGTYCGCVPVALAQLMKFHNYPPRGNQSITYQDPQYGSQSADFCNTIYDWANMPDELTGPNDDVAEFIYHTGAATQTSYSTTYSETFVSYIRDALVHFFNYDEAANWFYDNNNDFARIAIDDLNLGRPVLVTGVAPNNGGAHSWVVDGYGYFLMPDPNQPNEFFHFNWGWGGDNNGWFLDTGASWAPVPGEVGTQVITYYYERYVIHNVFPSAEQCGAPINSLTHNSFYTSGITNDGAYLHYFEPSLQNDQEVSYRYRKIGDTNWINSPVTMQYYFRASGLQVGTDYEFQVRRKCCGANWSDYSESFLFSTTGGTSACDNFLNSNLSTSNISDSGAYVYTSQPYGQVTNQFRYRFVGSTIWTFSDLSTNYYRLLSGLQAATNYEFQVRHMCSPGVWTDFSSIMTFTTTGNAGCGAALQVDLFTSSVSDNNAYVYTSQPYGKVNNQFRYRPTGTATWLMSSVTDNYYRYLSGLMSGTEYEFQVAHQCQPNAWTDWSFSHTFTTTGGTSTGSCDAVSGDRLYNSSISKNAAYVYTPQPFGNVANQFRYRPVGASTWLNSSVSTLYYRYLTNLQSDTDYEFQVAHECNIGQWTVWSTSKTFRTLAALTGGGGPGKLLPRSDSPLFKESMLDQTTVTIYPNPVTTYLTFESTVMFEEGANLEIMDMQGRTIRRENLSEGQSKIELEVSGFTPGIYLMKYDNGYEYFIDKFVKH